MTLGIILGAWLMSRHGWAAVWWSAGCLALLTTIDKAYGADLGSHLARWTLEIVK